jgi:hypothetical protein
MVTASTSATLLQTAIWCDLSLSLAEKEEERSGLAEAQCDAAESKKTASLEI